MPSHYSLVEGGCMCIWASDRGLQRFYDCSGSSEFVVLDVRSEVSYISLRASLVVFAKCLWLVYGLLR